MNTKLPAMALLFVALCAWSGRTGEPAPGVLPSIPTVGDLQPTEKDKGTPPAKEKDKDKQPPEKKLTDAPDTELFTQTPMPIRDALGLNPHMLGDLGFVFAQRNVPVVGTQTISTVTTFTPLNMPANLGVISSRSTSTPLPGNRRFLVPVANYGAFKVAENASPMPIDRVYFTYNFYNDARAGQSNSIGGSAITDTSVQRLRTGTLTTTTTVSNVLPGAPFVNLHREVLGFEKTFLDGRASMEFRLPVYQQTGNLDDFRAAHIGDVTIIGKYALLLDRAAGNVLSGGLAVTAPTGPTIQTINGSVHSTLLQPWFGYVWNYNRTYVQAFHSTVLPTDAHDLTLLFNDIGVGYWAYRGQADRPLRFIVPTAEVHVTTPLSNRGANVPITAFDTVVMTGGVHLGLYRGSLLSFGVASPITGPRIYGVEAFVQYNRRF